MRSYLNQLLKHSIADILRSRKDETKNQHKLFTISVWTLSLPCLGLMHAQSLAW